MTRLNPQKMTMVVARYNENLNWLKPVPWDYIVYNKGEDNLPKWVKNEIKLPNIGREAHTYLTFIIDNYDNLPDYTVFLQGNPFSDRKDFLLKMLEEFKGGADFYTLSQIKVGAHGYLTRNELRVVESARKIFIDEIQRFPYPAGAQFIVSNKGLHFHTKLTYQKIMEVLADEKFDIVCSHRRGPCAVCQYSRLFSPWVMERLWKVLFEHKTIYD